MILGVCNPRSAHAVLRADKDLGLLLPCNVIVYEDAGNVFVSAILPLAALGAVGNSNLMETAE